MENKIKRINKLIFDIGFLILIMLFTNILITTLFQFINIKMSAFNLVLSSIIAIIFFYLLRKKENKVNLIISLIVAVLVCLIATFIVEKTFDTSCDGMFYHKTAIGLIEEGWNPIYQGSEEFCNNNDTELENKGEFLWIDHYPKATWNIAASIYSITGNIESGKVLTVLFMISTFCLAYSYLAERFLKKWQAFIIAFLLVANPIALAQVFTYYLDGAMGLLIFDIILFLIYLSDNKFIMLSKLEKWIGLTAAIVLCMNVKFTGIYFATIFSIVFYIYWLIKSYKEKDLKNSFIKLTLNFAIIVIIGIIFVGASTYVKNTIDHKMPLYPLFGEGKVDIITTMQPKSFAYKNRFEKLFESIFSYSENITYDSGNTPKLKIPFSMSHDEFVSLIIPDEPIGGFGMLFGGIMILSIIGIIYSEYILFKKNTGLAKYIIVLLLGVIISVFCLDEAWWARYAPIIYLIPIIAVFSVFMVANLQNKASKKILINIFSIIISIIMLVNIYSFLYWRLYDLRYAKQIDLGLTELKSISKEDNKKEIAFNDIYYYGILFNLRDYKIPYKLTNDKLEKINYVYNGEILY